MTSITRALRDMLGWVCLRKELMQSDKKKKKKKKKICTVKPNAVTVFGTISLFQNHFIYFFCTMHLIWSLR